MRGVARARLSMLVGVVAISLCAAPALHAQVVIREAPDQIAVEIDGKPFTVFYIGGKDLKRPYLHRRPIILARHQGG